MADGRADWLGWLDLKMEAVNETATRMTAKVIEDIDADVIGLVEAENRPSLLHFRDDVMTGNGAGGYQHVMLIDGNDDRGIDVAIMTRSGFGIDSICSHVDDRGRQAHLQPRLRRVSPQDAGQRRISSSWSTTSRARASAPRPTPTRSASARRERVQAIYDRLQQNGAKHVAVIGDLNDTPDSDPLAPLLQDTDLRDISEHRAISTTAAGRAPSATARRPTRSTTSCSRPACSQKTTGGQIFRQGVWGGKHGTLFPHFPEITKASESASDHAAVVAEINL